MLYFTFWTWSISRFNEACFLRVCNLRLARNDSLAELDEHQTSNPAVMVGVVIQFPLGTTLFFAETF